MRFKVIVNGHNRANLLDECLASVIKSGFTDILYCDDGSTDSAVSIAESFNVSIIKRPVRGGALIARFDALESLKNENSNLICVCVDGDDVLLDDAKRRLEHEYEKGKDMVCGGMLWGNSYKGFEWPYFNHNVLEEKRLKKDIDWTHVILPHVRSFKLGLYREMRRMDPDMTLMKSSNGTWAQRSTDLALFTPMLALCKPERVSVLLSSEVVYKYRGPSIAFPALPPAPDFSNRLNNLILKYKQKTPSI